MSYLRVTLFASRLLTLIDCISKAVHRTVSVSYAYCVKDIYPGVLL